MDRAKPYDIPKREVWEAYKRVTANQGAAGVDGQTIADFEADLSNNLYKRWNRMSSGSYFPPPVRRVDIPKDVGKTRSLGIPTVADRVAEMVVKRFLGPLLEPEFHKESYGYRPGKSALDAVGMARQRCWRQDARRPNRERGTLVSEQTRLINSIKAIFARFGVRSFRLSLRQAADRLESIRTAEETPLPDNTRAELYRFLERLNLVRADPRHRTGAPAPAGGGCGGGELPARDGSPARPDHRHRR